LCLYCCETGPDYVGAGIALYVVVQSQIVADLPNPPVIMGHMCLPQSKGAEGVMHSV
jgi:hypothetical protein